MYYKNYCWRKQITGKLLIRFYRKEFFIANLFVGYSLTWTAVKKIDTERILRFRQLYTMKIPSPLRNFQTELRPHYVICKFICSRECLLQSLLSEGETMR